MNEHDFEGTLILEQLARIDGVDEFMAAADAQDFVKAAALMRVAGIDEETIILTLKKMADPYDEH
jgi:hypothetical protein